MKIRPLLTMLIVVCLTTACAAILKSKATEPAISEITDSYVKVETSGADSQGTEWPTAEEIKKEAQRGCGRYGKKAEYISHVRRVMPVSAYTSYAYRTYLFTCS